MARAARQLELAGVFASAITPRRGNTQDADFSGLLDLLDFLASGGVKGVCLCGPTGEFLNYSFAERQRMIYLGVKRSRVPILAGVSHSTFAGAVQLADEAIAAGADGLILMPPYFFRYAQSEIEEFYLEFAKETGDAVPIVIQNFPQVASAIGIDLMRRLIDTGRFAGIEDSSGDPETLRQLLELRRTRPFALLSGDDRRAAEALRAGAHGVISGVACAAPEVLMSLAQAIAANAEAQAEAMHARLLEFVEWADRFPYPVAIKRAVELRGQHSAPPLAPLGPEARAALDEFSKWFAAWLPQAKKAASNG
ncbi:MAG TPA: dihydrodipicolinate synthase family protein [Bryobacteraceae bacterium]|nr:dihydrodipicolinate synthase family protein [Bryobacteraceae bacterium]